MGETNLYCRENLEQFFKWKDDSALAHFPDELECDERAQEYALSHFRSCGFISFKSKYRGKRYFWIESGESYEIDPMECFIRIRDLRYDRARNIIHKKLFK